MISSFPLNNLDHKFYCPQQGTYGLWYKGPATYRPSFWQKPILIHADTNQAVALLKNLAAHRSSDFKGFVASLVFVFDAVQGDYQITYPENLGTYFYLVPPLISGYRQGAMTDFTIEIREALAPYKVLLLIPLILLSIFAFIGGLVMAILAEKMMLNGHFLFSHLM